MYNISDFEFDICASQDLEFELRNSNRILEYELDNLNRDLQDNYNLVQTDNMKFKKLVLNGNVCINKPLNHINSIYIYIENYTNIDNVFNIIIDFKYKTNCISDFSMSIGDLILINKICNHHDLITEHKFKIKLNIIHLFGAYLYKDSPEMNTFNHIIDINYKNNIDNCYIKTKIIYRTNITCMITCHKCIKHVKMIKVPLFNNTATINFNYKTTYIATLVKQIDCVIDNVQINNTIIDDLLYIYHDNVTYVLIMLDYESCKYFKTKNTNSLSNLKFYVATLNLFCDRIILKQGLEQENTLIKIASINNIDSLYMFLIEYY